MKKTLSWLTKIKMYLIKFIKLSESTATLSQKSYQLNKSRRKKIRKIINLIKLENRLEHIMTAL
jgi:hypothetical protein